MSIYINCPDSTFGGCGLSGFGDILTFYISSNFSFGPWTIVHGGQKIELTKKFMQVMSFLFLVELIGGDDDDDSDSSHELINNNINHSINGNVDVHVVHIYLISFINFLYHVVSSKTNQKRLLDKVMVDVCVVVYYHYL